MLEDEYSILKKRFIIGVIVSIIFALPMIVFLGRASSSTNILSKIKRKESFTIIITKNNCDECSKTVNEIKNKHISYSILNKDSNGQYEEIMNKLDFSLDEDVPILVYVKKGKLENYLVVGGNIDRVDAFIKENNLIYK